MLLGNVDTAVWFHYNLQRAEEEQEKNLSSSFHREYTVKRNELGWKCLESFVGWHCSACAVVTTTKSRQKCDTPFL